MEIPVWFGKQEYYTLIFTAILFITTTFIVNIANVYPQLKRLLQRVIFAPVILFFWVHDRLKTKEM